MNPLLAAFHALGKKEPALRCPAVGSRNEAATNGYELRKAIAELLKQAHFTYSVGSTFHPHETLSKAVTAHALTGSGSQHLLLLASCHPILLPYSSTQPFVRLPVFRFIHPPLSLAATAHTYCSNITSYVMSRLLPDRSSLQ